MQASIRRGLRRRKRSITRRLAGEGPRRTRPADGGPVADTNGLRYELPERSRGFAHGGAPLLHRLAGDVGLVEAIDRRLHLLKIHRPYHESDHVLNLALNALCEGRCLEDVELRRNDEAYLDALGAESIPDPTTAGDFCRRFDENAVWTLMDAVDEARLKVWGRQSDDFFDEAVLDADGTFVVTTGECKGGMDMSYKCGWGYGVQLISLANTGEPLSIVNRPASRPSAEGAAHQLDWVVGLCRRGGFRKVRLRGDTAFSQSEHLDRWDDEGVLFQFGYQAAPNLVELAENLPESAWTRLKRPAKYKVKTKPRRRPANVKRRVIRERGFLHLELKSEEVAEFEYRPTACSRPHRMVVVRKNVSRERGEAVLFDEVRYFFYVTNDRAATAAEIVFGCNGRCDQENLIAQLAGGVRALTAPVDNLISNWAYMVMTSLAWTLKAWSALLLPVGPRWRERHEAERRRLLRMEFRTFVNAMVKVPVQIVKRSRRTVLRVLGWNEHLPTFFRLAGVLRC